MTVLHIAAARLGGLMGLFALTSLFALAACAGEPSQSADKTAETETVAETAISETAIAETTAAAEPAPLMRWPDLTSRPLPEPTATISTGKRETDIVDLFLPEGDGPFPVVLMIHGGCWQKAIADRTLMNYAAKALSEAGFAVWNIEYRGVDEDGGGFPGTFYDVGRAADALRDHADTYDLDLTRLAAYGHSAGGHLALWLAARSRIPEPGPLYAGDPLHVPAVLSTGGLPDLEAAEPVTLESCLAAIKDQLIGAPGPLRADPLDDTSPDRLLPMGVRQVSLNATRDTIAPPLLGKAYTEKAQSAGDPARYVEAPGGHVELITPGTPAFDETIRLLKELTAPTP